MMSKPQLRLAHPTAKRRASVLLALLVVDVAFWTIVTVVEKYVDLLSPYSPMALVRERTLEELDSLRDSCALPGEPFSMKASKWELNGFNRA